MTSVASLKACPLFKGFTQTGLQIIAAIAGERVFPKGVPLFVENMVGDSLLIISRGKVRLTAKSRTGQEVAVDVSRPVEFRGEVTLVRERAGQSNANATLSGYAACVS